MDKVAAIIVNYNMPEVVQHNIDILRDNTKVPLDIIVLDNASYEDHMFIPNEEDEVHMIYLDYNLHNTHGFRMGLSYAKSLEALSWEPYFAYLIGVTSGEFIDDGSDPILPLYDFLKEDENAVIVQAAHDESSIGFWEHLKSRGTGKPRRTWMMEHSLTLFRADWFDSVDWLHPGLHIHGTDLFYSWQAREQGRGIYVHEGIEMHRHWNNMFDMGRAPEANPGERSVLARKSMVKTLEPMLGENWEQRLLQEYVEEDWI
jgi:GT2 family glycosyltransferase